MFRLLPVVFLAACSTTPDQFTESFPAPFCEYAVPCIDELPPGSDTGEVSTASCESEVTDSLATLAKDEACTFDAEAADACTAALEAASSCSDAEAVRDACENIYTGDDCDVQLYTLL